MTNQIDVLMSVEVSDQIIEMEISDSGPGGRLPFYEGDYTVIPKVGKEQTLETAYRSMMDNVTVAEIPADKVSNKYGTTFIIGG